jgi:hypothetical protein
MTFIASCTKNILLFLVRNESKIFIVFSGKIVFRKFHQNYLYPRTKNFGVDQMNSAYNCCCVEKNHKLRYL